MLDRDALRALQDLIGGDRADLIDLISGFLEEAPGMFDALLAAGAAGDGASARRVAHTMKSNARDLGASSLAAACAQLEADLSSDPGLADLAGRVQALHALWPATRAAMEAEMSGEGDGN